MIDANSPSLQRTETSIKYSLTLYSKILYISRLIYITLFCIILLFLPFSFSETFQVTVKVPNWRVKNCAEHAKTSLLRHFSYFKGARSRRASFVILISVYHRLDHADLRGGRFKVRFRIHQCRARFYVRFATRLACRGALRVYVARTWDISLVLVLQCFTRGTIISNISPPRRRPM